MLSQIGILVIVPALFCGIPPEALPDDSRPPMVDEHWPAYFEITLLDEVHGYDADDRARYFSRGYLLHRRDLETSVLLHNRLQRCLADVDVCEREQAEAAANPPFWRTAWGDAIKVITGVVVGAGLAIGIFAVTNR